MKNIIFYLFLLFLSTGCSLSIEEQTLDFKKPPEEKFDFYGQYLHNPENTKGTAYMSFFYKRYNQLMRAGKVDSAAQILSITGRTLSYVYQIDTSFLKLNLSFLKKFEYKISEKKRSELYYNIGNIYDALSNNNLGVFYLEKALLKPVNYDGVFTNAVVNYNLLFSYLNNGKLDKSLKAGQEALKLFEKIKDVSWQGNVYSGIACIYNFEDNYTEALRYEQKAYELAVASRDTSTIIVVSLNKINTFNSSEHPNLLSFIDSTHNIYNKWSEPKTIRDDIAIESWFALKMVRENRLKEANIILKKTKTKIKEIDDEVAENYFYNALAEYDVKAGVNAENTAIYKRKIPNRLENEDYVSLKLYYQILHDEALAKKDFENARIYLEKAEIAEDSLSNKILRNKVAELDKKYQTEKKEQQIQIQQQEITQKNTYIALLVASLSGLLLAVLAYYSWQRQKLLRQEKTNSMNFTKQLLENTEDERKRIASDLHDSISHELLNLKSIFSQDLSVVNKKIDTIINDIRGISRNLHPVMFDKIGLVPNVEQLVERIQNQNNFFISTDMLYTGVLTSADELQIYRIIQEALTNIIKYAKAHAAKITVLEEKDKILIEIRDNGKGFDVKQALNSGKAFGLHNIIERSRVIGGEANISSSSEGTVITINIPRKL